MRDCTRRFWANKINHRVMMRPISWHGTLTLWHMTPPLIGHSHRPIMLTCDPCRFARRIRSGPPTSWWSCPCCCSWCSHRWGGRTRCSRCGRGHASSWCTRTSGSPITWWTCRHCTRRAPSHPYPVSRPKKICWVNLRSVMKQGKFWLQNKTFLFDFSSF